MIKVAAAAVASVGLEILTPPQTEPAPPERGPL